jgi:large subunit ribosomal protein L3
MKYILGTKQEMVQFFNEDGKAVPATVIAAGPVTITQVKTNDTDGYDAVQIGYGTQDEKRIPKARLGQMKGFGPFRHLKEFRIKDGATVPSVGESLTVDQFTVGDTVQITGVSKGKGFLGVVNVQKSKRQRATSSITALVARSSIRLRGCFDARAGTAKPCGETARLGEENLRDPKRHALRTWKAKV